MTQKTSNFFYSLIEQIDESNNKIIFYKIILDHYKKTVINLKKNPEDKIFLFFKINAKIFFCVNNYKNNKTNIIEIYNLKNLKKYFNKIESNEINYITKINTISKTTKDELLKYIQKLLGINILLIVDKSFESLNKIKNIQEKTLNLNKIICKNFKNCDLSKYQEYNKIFIKKNSFNNFQIFPDEKKFELNYENENGILEMFLKIYDYIEKN